MSMPAYELLQRNGNSGRARFAPSAISLHPFGPALHDDLWLIEVPPSGTVRMHNVTTRHVVDLQPEDVLSAEVDPQAPQGGLVYLRVRLARRLWMRGVEVGWISPQRRMRRPPRMSRQQC